MFTGTGRLLRLAVRRDRIKLPIWIIAVVGLLASVLPALSASYGTYEEQVLYQTMLSSSAIGKLFAGNVDVASFGAVVTAESMLYVGLAIAFMNILLVVRHTRHNEELGSSELLHSARVGRYSALTAALLLALAANILVAIGLAVTLGSHTDITWSQGMLYAAGLGLLGMSFAAIAAVTSQLSGSARGASSMAAAVIGATFLLRGIGDVFASVGADGLSRPGFVSYLSPFGWLQMSRPLTEQHWPMMFIPIIFVSITFLISYSLLTRRDIGSGMLPARAGAEKASGRLLALAPIGLVVRMQKGLFIGWLIGAVVMAVTTGGMIKEVVGFVEESEVVRDYVQALGGSGNLTDTFLSAMLAMIAMVLIAYVVQSIQRIRTEETRGYAESLFGTALGRARWLLSYFAVVGAGAFIILTVSGLALAVSSGIAYGSSVADWDMISYSVSAVSYLPALLLFAGLTIFIFGLMPRMTMIVAWLSFTYVVFIGQLGALLKLPSGLMNLTPFAHLSAVPAAEVRWLPIIILCLITASLLLVGIIGFRNRDLTTG